jgi:serine protease Do
MDYGNLDEQLARLHPEIKSAAERFVLLRLGDMRGLDLDLFEFDYDLTWVALLFDPDGTVLGRFGGRDADTPGKYHSLPAVRYSLEQAWDRFQHRETTKQPRAATPAKRVEQYAAAQRFSKNACFHCHNVAEFRREERQAAGIWRKEEVWVYPDPASLGLSMAVAQGNKVAEVAPHSAAAQTGIRPGDIVRLLHGIPTASFLDVQFALNQAPTMGKTAVAWTRGEREFQGEIALPAGWRESDVSWRWSLKSMKPLPQVHGDDLTAAEKAALGFGPRRLAFRQDPFVPQAAQQAGLKISDIIVGVDDRRLDLTSRQFEAFMRLNYKVGDTVHFDVLRGGQKLKVALKLPG